MVPNVVQATAVNIKPKMLQRIANNYLDWCGEMGTDRAKQRLASFTDTETLVLLKPVIVEEMKKRGLKA